MTLINLKEEDVVLTYNDMRVWRIEREVVNGYHAVNPNNSDEFKLILFGDYCIKFSMVAYGGN